MQGLSAAGARGSLSTVRAGRSGLRSTRVHWRKWPAPRKTQISANGELFGLVGGIPGKLHVGQTDAADKDLVRADVVRSREAHGSIVRDEVILIDAVAADAQSSHQRGPFEDSSTSREKHNPALKCCHILRLKTLRTRVRQVVYKQIEKRTWSKKEWSRIGIVNTRWE